ncbi:MAG: porin family protein, partial [Candidatus Cloacimonetes bacterium]|nr:porin family protein [Candidatus Cloacimonadota bacterium]
MKRALLFSIIISVFLIPQSVHAQNMAGQSHFGLHLSGIQMMGGDESSQFKTWGGFNFGHLFTDRFGLDFSLSAGWTRPGEDEDNISYRTYLYPFSVSARYYLKEDSRLSPYLTAGLGVLFWGLRDVTDEDDTLLPFNPEGSIIGDSVNRESFALLGIGAQYYLSDAISLDLGLRYNYLIEHETDLSGYGDEHSGIIEARLGINFIFTCKQDSEVKKAVVQVIPELPVVTPVEVAEPVKVVEVVEEPEPVVEEEIILEVVEESPVKEAELVFEEKAP